MVVRVTYVSSDSLTYGKRSYMVVRVTNVMSDSLTPILSSILATNHGSSSHRILKTLQPHPSQCTLLITQYMRARKVLTTGIEL